MNYSVLSEFSFKCKIIYLMAHTVPIVTTVPKTNYLLFNAVISLELCKLCFLL